MCSAKRKLIALLEEEKQAVINQAVTRGLDPNVRLKPSGVEWLGDVPEHWEMRRTWSRVLQSLGNGSIAIHAKTPLPFSASSYQAIWRHTPQADHVALWGDVRWSDCTSVAKGV